MRLVYFDFTINFGGAPQGSVYLAQRLNEKHTIHIVDAYGCCEDYRKAVETAGLSYHVLCPHVKDVYIGHRDRPWRRVWRLMRQIPVFLLLRSRLVQTIKQIDPDVIWVNNHKSLALVASCGVLNRIPVVVYIRGWATPDQVSGRYLRLINRRVSAIIAHAKASLEQLKHRGLPANKLHYTPNTIAFDEIYQKAKGSLQEPLPDRSRSPKILLPAARPVREKGHLTAIYALVRLKQAGYDPVLWLPGKIATGVSDAFQEQLRGLIALHGLQKNVNFLGWRHDMQALIQNCDVVILPTHTEGFPRVILEAMLLKKPVVATPVGGIPEAIQDGRTGIMIEINNDRQLAEAIRKYMTNPEFGAAITQQAFDFVNETFRPEINTQIVYRVFESVLGR